MRPLKDACDKQIGLGVVRFNNRVVIIAHVGLHSKPRTLKSKVTSSKPVTDEP